MPDLGPSSLRSGVQRNFVKVDGADGADVRTERRAGLVAVGEQPVGEHGTGGGASEVSGICVMSVHWDVQQRGEGPGGVLPLPGPPGPGQTELLQLVQQVALLLHLLSVVELKASSVIWRETQVKMFSFRSSSGFEHFLNPDFFSADLGWA